MTDENQKETPTIINEIQGDVGKLIQIGALNGPLQINLDQNLMGQFAQLVAQAIANSQSQTSAPTTPLPPPDSPPSIFPGSARREWIVDLLCTELSKITWLNVKGAAGIGKSFIARLITIKHGASNTVWVSLRGERNREETLLSLLNGHLLRIASPSESNLNQTYTAGKVSFAELAKKAATALGQETMLVIDEMPDLAKNTLLAKNIAELSLAIWEVGGKFLTTSQRSLPSNILLELSHIGISEKGVIALSIEDIIEVLQGLGAPLFVIEEKYPQLILEKTNGYPFLTLAIASYIRDCKWIVNAEVLDSIDKGVPTRKIEAEMLKTISQLLPDENVRDLLYRLSLMETSFDTSLVRDLAGLSQTIARPMELFVELVGPWVNQLMENNFEISPLIRNIGERILEPKQQEAVHYVIARYYLYKGGIDPYLAFQVVKHLVLANNWHLLVIVLVRFAYQVTKKEHAKAFEPIIVYIDRTELNNVPDFVHIATYSTKLLIYNLIDKPTGDLLTTLSRLLQKMKKTDMDEYTLLTVFSVEILLMQPHNPTLSAGAVAKTMLQACQTAQKLGSLPVPLKISKDLLQQFMWMGVRRISTRTDIREILMVLKELSTTERKTVLSDKIMLVSPNILVDMCWELELRKANNEQDWDGTLKLLEEISEVAEMPGAESLKPLVGRAKAVVLADYMNQLTRAIEVIDSLLSTSDSDGRFILNHTAGNCFIQRERFEDALSRYQMALADFTDFNQDLHFDVLRRASHAAGKTGNFELMRDLAIRALQCKKLYASKINDPSVKVV